MLVSVTCEQNYSTRRSNGSKKKEGVELRSRQQRRRVGILSSRAQRALRMHWQSAVVVLVVVGLEEVMRKNVHSRR